jgi:predicted dithiol-disulfide oxidoreductase (DUF899 family)
MSCQLIDFFQDNCSALGYNSVVGRQLSSNQLSVATTMLNTYKNRMDWDLPWVSSSSSDFNFDFGATVDEDEKHGVSVFLRDGNDIYRTYYTGARGCEYLGSHWTYLDLTPFGRQETWEDSPEGWPQTEPYD